LDEIYQSIPDFAGFVIKADSEGPRGPFEVWAHPQRQAGEQTVAPRTAAAMVAWVLYRGFLFY